MTITIPESSLVLLIGPHGAGKSTFAARHFANIDILTANHCRTLLGNPPPSDARDAEVEAMHRTAVASRLRLMQLTVVDDTHTYPEERAPWLDLARRYHLLAVAIVIDLPERECKRRNSARSDREVSNRVIHGQKVRIGRALRTLRAEGFHAVHHLSSVEGLEQVRVVQTPLNVNRTDQRGPFDIVGPVRGRFHGLKQLLNELGYVVDNDNKWQAPGHRLLVFLGDLFGDADDPHVAALIGQLFASEVALAVPGPTEVALEHLLTGRPLPDGIPVAPSAIESIAARIAPDGLMADRWLRQVSSWPSHLVLDKGALVVAARGLPEEMHGRVSQIVRHTATIGDESAWMDAYDGRAIVAHAAGQNRAYSASGRLIDLSDSSAIVTWRWPERELHTVSKNVGRSVGTTDWPVPLRTVIGHHSIDTRLRREIRIRPEASAAALEEVSRFGIDPRWLIYLPPTMAAPDPSDRDGLLEHPDEPLHYYRKRGFSTLIVEEKHMGSRGVAVVCRDPAVAQDRFGLPEPSDGILYTRTGRPLLSDGAVERDILGRIRAGLDAIKFWSSFDTDWVLLDGELLPWSATSSRLITERYDGIAAVGQQALGTALQVARQCQQRLPSTPLARAQPGGSSRPTNIAALVAELEERQRHLSEFSSIYQRYCWPVSSVDDLSFAPFHWLAWESGWAPDLTHRQMMELSDRLAAAVPSTVRATRWRTCALNDQQSVAEAIQFWEELIAEGGEGIVLKPESFIPRGRNGLAQPAMKVRGAEFLTINYGPEYRRPQHVASLRGRKSSMQRSLAIRQFALGLEAIERFRRRAPLHETHVAAFGCIALDASSVDPTILPAH